MELITRSDDERLARWEIRVSPEPQFHLLRKSLIAALEEEKECVRHIAQLAADLVAALAIKEALQTELDAWIISHGGVRNRAEDAERKLCAARERERECVHCGESVSNDIDHWRGCTDHPANAQIREIQTQLCKAKDYLLTIKSSMENVAGAFIGYIDIDTMTNNLHQSSPCRHEAELKESQDNLRFATNELMTLANEKPHNISIFDESGKEYIIRWDNGDESVGIRAGWVSEDLDDIFDALSSLRAVIAERDELKEVLDDKRRLTRELDVAMHGEEGAAKQASLCDLIRPAGRLRADLASAIAAKEEAERDLKLCARYLRKRGIDIVDLRRS